MDFSWNAIDIEVPNKNKRYNTKRIKLVKDAYGSMQNGLLAIMGPSGSGKTTLINAFAGRIPKGSITTGKITWNHSERTNFDEWQSSLGFVDQDNSIYEELTAREIVSYSAKFRLKGKYNNLKLKIEQLFDKLSIIHVIDNKMKNLSGGERKRVMIAVELITDPNIIFLDEPTSNLDNNTALKIVRLLKSLSQERIIIFTIHQPDEITADEFDKICLLTQGRTAFMGDFKDCEKNLAEKGFKRNDRETFSNFAMRVLDVGYGVYHETASDEMLDELVNDVKNRFETNSTLKIERRSNDHFINYKLNLIHILLIYKRRLKIQILHKKTLLKLFSSLLFPLLLIVFWRYPEKHIKPLFDAISEDFDLNTPTEQTLDIKKEFIPNVMRKSFLFSLCAPIIYAALPLTAGISFYPEKEQVKREIGVNTYSCSSYYLAVFLCELTNVIPSFILIAVSFKFFLKVQLGISQLSMCLFQVCAAISMFLLAGSISSSPRLTQVIFAVFRTLNIIPLVWICIVLKFSETINSSWIYMAFNILPTYPITTFFLDITISEILRVIEGKIKGIQGNPITIKAKEELSKQFNTEIKKEFQEALIPALRSISTGFEINPYWTLLFAAVSFGLWIFLGIILQSRVIKTPLRYKLNG